MSMKAEISVCILTFNPSKRKLLQTLESVLAQRNVDLQIIISDDGSANNCFDEAVEVMDKIGFHNYKLVPASENQGTVKNLEKALAAADGEYIKVISPGDCLIGKTVLSDWLEHLKKSKKLWSFCETQYYTVLEDNVPILCTQPAHPQLVDVYLKHDDSVCRWNYTVLDDIALGAAMLGRRDIMLSYIQRISHEVKYAEDNMFRLMMFDGIVADYYPVNAVLYEYGTGVSTSGDSKWSKRLQDDWNATDKIILSANTSDDKFKCRMQKAIKRRKCEKMIVRVFAKCFDGYSILKTVRVLFNRRMTDCAWKETGTCR